MSFSNTRVDRYAHRLTVRQACSAADVDACMQLRFQGYSCFANKDEAEDPYDRQTNCTLLLTCDGTGRPVGTMRLLDGRTGEVELEKYLDIGSLHGHARSFIEATRFTVCSGRLGATAKLLLAKAAFLYSEAQGVDRVLIATKPNYESFYRRLQFIDAGMDNFIHSSLGGSEHQVLQAILPTLREQLSKNNEGYLKFLEDPMHHLFI